MSDSSAIGCLAVGLFFIVVIVISIYSDHLSQCREAYPSRIAGVRGEIVDGGYTRSRSWIRIRTADSVFEHESPGSDLGKRAHVGDSIFKQPGQLRCTIMSRDSIHFAEYYPPPRSGCDTSDY